MDYYLLTSYVFVVLSIIENVLVFLLVTDYENAELAKRIDRMALIVLPVAFALFNLHWFVSCHLARSAQRKALLKEAHAADHKQKTE